MLFAHVDSQVCQRGEQQNITNPILPHPLKHIQTIKIISVKIDFDHMNVCVGKTRWFKICYILEKITQTHAWTHTYETEKSQYLGLIYFHALEGTNFTYIPHLLEPGRTGVVGFLLLPESTCIGLCCHPTSCQRLDHRVYLNVCLKTQDTLIFSEKSMLKILKQFWEFQPESF